MRITAVFIILCFVKPLLSQTNQQEHFSVMFYNVENLFDCRDDSNKLDEEFLPTSEKAWSENRMYRKINGLSKTIIACNGWHAPDIIGLCEIENRFVLTQLIYNTGIASLNYQFVHYESDDKRGIDVALLYRKNRFTPLHSQPVKLSNPSENFYTRDALYVKGIIQKDTFHILINHWPSKRGGSVESSFKRAIVSEKIAAVIDSIQTTEPSAQLIVMGDFNTELNTDELQTLQTSANISSLLTNKTIANNKIGGSYKYQGQWSLIDHILVSEHWQNNNDYTFEHKVIELPFLLEPDTGNSGVKPKRTYIGPRYNGGISDHLPVILSVKKIN